MASATVSTPLPAGPRPQKNSSSGSSTADRKSRLLVTGFTKTGAKSQTAVALPKAIFDVSPKDTQLLAQAYRAYLANARGSHAQTLTRGQVRGGGRKPWRQKGTGRARAGSRRSPLWKGGGIIFGPTGQQNYTVKLPQKAKRLAIRQALSGKAKDGAIKIIETFECPHGKVKPTIEFLEKIGANGRVLLVVSVKDQLVERATRNIAGLKVVQANYLNVFDIINADTIVVSAKSLELIQSWLVAKAAAKAPVAKEQANG